MKSVFLIAILAVAMIGVMVPSVFGQETPSWIKEEFPEQKIPTWVKDVAILWTDDEITNDEFLNTIKYLKESNIIKITKITDYDFVDNETNSDKFNEIIQWYSSASDALQNPVKSNFVMPTIEGQIDSFRSKIPVELTIIDPNGESKTIADITRNGKYSVTPKNIEPIISGIYVIEIRVDGELTNTQYSFLDEGIGDIQNVSMDDSKKEIPSWIKKTAVWWMDDEITNDDFLQGIKFLVKTDVIPSKQIALSNFAAKIWSDANFNAIKNSKLTTLSNSDAFNILKYDTRQQCLEDILKNNQKTILNIKQCGKIIEDHTKSPKMYDTTKHILENRYNPKIYDKLGFETENKLDARDFGTRDECVKEAQSDGKYDILEKTVCDKVNRTWAVDTIIYDDYGNKVGTQALNNCNDSNCNSYGSYNSGYYGGYDYNYNDADVQRYLSQADSFAQNYLNALEPYAQQYLNDIEPYAQQYVNGDISYGQYEQFAMQEYGGYESSALDLYSYYENQFMNEFYEYP
jgi:hypothetical protein